MRQQASPGGAEGRAGGRRSLPQPWGTTDGGVGLGRAGSYARTKSEIPEELDRALDAASQAEELLRAVGDRVGEGKALHTIAVALSFQNEVDEAVARSRELVSYWRDLGYRRLEAFQQECVSEWELARHRPEEALEAAQAALEQKALREAQETADVRMPSRSAAALIHASNAYLTMGMTEEADGGDESLSRKEGHQQEWALKLSKERLEVFQKNADFESEVVAQSSIVSVYVNSDRLQEAADVAEETRGGSTSEDRKSLAACYLLQSELALLKKENRLGLKAAMKSRDLSRKTGTKKGEASALLQLCSAYCARGELKRGAAVTVEAQRIFNSVADREGEADALRMQAEVRMHLNDFTRAIAASRRCRELQREMGDRKSEAWACGLAQGAKLDHLTETTLSSPSYLTEILSVLDILSGEKEDSDRRRAVRAALFEGARKPDEGLAQYALRRESQFELANRYVSLPEDIKGILLEEQSGLPRQAMQNLRVLTKGQHSYSEVKKALQILDLDEESMIKSGKTSYFGGASEVEHSESDIDDEEIFLALEAQEVDEEEALCLMADLQQDRKRTWKENKLLKAARKKDRRHFDDRSSRPSRPFNRRKMSIEEIKKVTFCNNCGKKDLMPDIQRALQGQTQQLAQSTAAVMSQVMSPVIEGFHQALRCQVEEQQRAQERQDAQMQQLFLAQQRIMQQNDMTRQQGACFPALSPEEIQRLLAQGFADTRRYMQQQGINEDEDWDAIPESPPGQN
eukprot:g30781.t1